MRGTEGAGSLSRTEQYTIATGGGRVGGGVGETGRRTAAAAAKGGRKKRERDGKK